MLAQVDANRATILSYRHTGSVDDAVGADIARWLRQNTSLVTLDLAGNPIGERTVQHITIALVRYNRTLQVLDLSATFVGDGGARVLAHILRRNRFVRELHLADSRISDLGALHFSHALSTNRTLEQLDLRQNRIQNQGTIRVLLRHRRRIGNHMQAIVAVVSRADNH